MAEAIDSVPPDERRPPVLGALERRIAWFHEAFESFVREPLALRGQNP